MRFASRPVIIPFDVEIIAVPIPPTTVGIAPLSIYHRNPGLLILFTSVIAELPLSYRSITCN